MSKKLQSILVAITDDTQGKTALKRALHIAQSESAKLSIVSVLQKIHGSLSSQERKKIEPGELKEYCERHEVERVHKLLAKLTDSAEEIPVKVRMGNPSIEIIREVLEEKPDYLIKEATRVKKDSKGSGFGSVAMNLVRKCPCPVLIVRPTRRKIVERILVAIDTEAQDSELQKFATEILKAAHRLSECENAELHVIHAWELFGEQFLRSPRYGVSLDELEEMFAELRQSREHTLRELLKASDLSEKVSQIHLKKGSAERAILKTIKKEKIDVLVIGTIARTRIAGFLIGNTADRLLREAPCSILAIKPENFECPVKLE